MEKDIVYPTNSEYHQMENTQRWATNKLVNEDSKANWEEEKRLKALGIVIVVEMAHRSSARMLARQILSS